MFITERERIYMNGETGETLAEITFRETEPGVITIEHTRVDPSLRGQGIAAKLVRAAVEEIDRRGEEVRATCSYATKWLAENGAGAAEKAEIKKGTPAIRRAEERDIPRVIALLQQVLEIHVKLRPDLFVSGTTKYTPEELLAIFSDERTPVFVATDERDAVLGYVFCVIEEPTASNNMIPRRTLYIDDLCVDEAARGSHVGEALYRYACGEAKRLGCYSVTLNVWEGNDAIAFYRAMGMKTKKTMMEKILD